MHATDLTKAITKILNMWQMREIFPPLTQKMWQIAKMWQIDQDGANWNSGGNSHNGNFIQISKDVANVGN